MARREINPTDWLANAGIQQAIEVRGAERLVFFSGQASVDPQGRVLHPGDVVAQFRQAWENLLSALTEGDLEPKNIVRLTIYTTDMPAYVEHIADIVPIYTANDCRPVSALYGLSALWDPDAMIELEVTAVA